MGITVPRIISSAASRLPESAPENAITRAYMPSPSGRKGRSYASAAAGALARALAAALLAPEHQGAGDPRKREPEQRLVRLSALDGRRRALCLALEDALADLPDAPAEDGVTAVDDAHARCSSSYRVLSRPLPCTPLSPVGPLPLPFGGGGGGAGFFGGGGLCGLWVFVWCRVWPAWWPGFAFFACWTPWPRARDGGSWLTSPPCVGFWGWIFFTSGRPWCPRLTLIDAPRNGLSSVCGAPGLKAVCTAETGAACWRAVAEACGVAGRRNVCLAPS